MIFFNSISLSIFLAFILEEHHLNILRLLLKCLVLHVWCVATFPERESLSKLEKCLGPSATSSLLPWDSLQQWLKISRMNKSKTFILPPRCLSFIFLSFMLSLINWWLCPHIFLCVEGSSYDLGVKWKSTNMYRHVQLSHCGPVWYINMKYRLSIYRHFWKIWLSIWPFCKVSI